MINLHPHCTLAVRFLGLVLVVFALPTIGRVTHDVLQDFCMGTGWSHLSPFVGYRSDEEHLSSIGSFAQFALGLYMFLNGRWIIGRLLRGLDGACPRCGYDITGVVGGRCPECGAKLPEDQSRPTKH